MASLTSPMSQKQLRSRIAPICHVLRLAIVAYPMWVIIASLSFWLDRERLTRTFTYLTGTDVSGFAVWQQAVCLTFVSISIGLVTAACVFGWRLFSGYLEGEVFSRQAAVRLRNLSLFGLAALGSDLVSRLIMPVIMTAHVQTPLAKAGFQINPHDLFSALALSGLLALAMIYKAAAELAEDHAGIL